MAQAIGRSAPSIQPRLSASWLRRLPRVTLAHVWLAVPLFAAGLGTGLMPVESIDYWWTVKLGELIWQAGALPDGDQLVFTPIREPVIHAQWLAQLVFYAAHSLGGPALALALRTIVALVVALLLVRIATDAGAGPRGTALAVGAGMLIVLPGLALRPQMLAVIPFLLIARASCSPPRTLAGALVLAMTFAVWANVHGSFVLGYVLLSGGLAQAVWDRRQGRRDESIARLSRLAVICVVAPLVNPNGLALVTYVWDTVVFNGVGSTVGILGVEWGPPALRSTYGGAFFASLLVAIVLLGRGHRPRLGESLLLILFGLMATQAVRHVLWWGLIVTPYVARGLSAWASPPSRPARRDDEASEVARAPDDIPAGTPALNTACLVLFATLVLACLPWWRASTPLPSDRTAILDRETPIAVGEYLATHQPPGELFNFTDWGAYFAWRLGPSRRVFVDDRFELHPGDVWRDYSTVGRGHVSWEEVLERYGVTQLALDPKSQAGLVQAVERSPRWVLSYEDERALVYERTPRER
ncbi:MAG: hypothetical protein H0V51_20715 [Chloroflexi bacterium]|nr:hypothetical protein [Chloroflexota bacterium]